MTIYFFKQTEMSEILNTSLHSQEEYEGKSVIFNNTEYIIGEFVSQGASKIVHKLINKKSNICSHVIKIHRDISDKSLLDRELIGHAIAQKARIASMKIFLADNGDRTYHIQELITFARECDSVLLKKGKDAFEGRNYEKARSFFQKLLNSENPYNTEALLGIFLCSAIQNENEEDRYILDKIIEIEPNSSYYYEFLYIYLLKWKRYGEAKKLFEQSEIEIDFEISDLINNEKQDEENMSVLDKQLENHINDFYIEKKTISLKEILKAGEDEINFFKLLNEYDKTKDVMLLKSLISIAKDNPQNKVFFEVCLPLVFDCGLYYSFIDAYEKSEAALDALFDIMAVQAYINVGQAEKLIPMLTQKNFEPELKQEIDAVINKKNQYAQLSDQALELFLSGDLQKAFEIQKEACDVYPWGYESILNRLLYYIYKEEQGQIQYAPIDGNEAFICYYLHLMIYYLVADDRAGIKKINTLTPTFYSVLLQVKEEIGTIPSRIGFYHKTGLFEYPIRETADFLKNYGDKRGIRDANYNKIVAFYQREGLKQESGLSAGRRNEEIPDETVDDF